MSSRSRQPNRVLNQLRLIGGQWRGRRLHFPDSPGLRPSPDRVRETLFNWLAPVVAGARCLDLYAGSGALGLEAASRGAARVCLVDRDSRVVQALQAHVQTLQAEGVTVVQAEALDYLRRGGEVFDIVFLDPPFRQDLLAPCIAALNSAGCLAEEAWIYLEAERTLDLAPLLPPGWQLHRSKSAGQLAYHLVHYQTE